MRTLRKRTAVLFVWNGILTWLVILMAFSILLSCAPKVKIEQVVSGGTTHKISIEVAVPDVLSGAFKNECNTPGATQQEIDACVGTKTDDYMQQIISLIANFQQHGQTTPLPTNLPTIN